MCSSINNKHTPFFKNLGRKLIVEEEDSYIGVFENVQR